MDFLANQPNLSKYEISLDPPPRGATGIRHQEMWLNDEIFEEVSLLYVNHGSCQRRFMGLMKLKSNRGFDSGDYALKENPEIVVFCLGCSTRLGRRGRRRLAQWGVSHNFFRPSTMLGEKWSGLDRTSLGCYLLFPAGLALDHNDNLLSYHAPKAPEPRPGAPTSGYSDSNDPPLEEEMVEEPPPEIIVERAEGLGVSQPSWVISARQAAANYRERLETR